MPTPATDVLFLGIDSSTQGLKIAAIDSSLAVTHEYALKYDDDLPEFGTNGGAIRHDDGVTVTSPPEMWVKAVDVLLARMQDDGFPFGRVAALCGSGQQHGSVWLKAAARGALTGLQADKTLVEQLDGVFAVSRSPIWMDSSTTVECRALEDRLGGPQVVADITGSRAYERFTGNQIAKIARRDPDAYATTDRIALVSSFMASLFVGDYAPIDASDGSGMNLLDIGTTDWSPAALAATQEGLVDKLGAPVSSHTVVGNVHPYFVARYGFSSGCAVVAFSGDNPCSLAGLRLQRAGDIAISLGTSDTVFGFLTEPRPSGKEGHIFVNPIDPDAYMAMICHQNGSLAREHVRDEFTEGSWSRYQEMMTATAPGNDAQIGIYVLEPEITPRIAATGVYRFGAQGNAVERFAPEVEARAILEGQFLSLRLHGAVLGLVPKAILATGGASVDKSVIRTMCDVFGVPVFTGDQPNSAGVGAAYRALHGWRCVQGGMFVPFADALGEASDVKKAAEPDVDAHAVYTAMLPRFTELENSLVE